MDRKFEVASARPSGRGDNPTPPASDQRRLRAAVRQYPFKRSFDVLASAALLLFLLPIAIIIAGLIGLGGGPIFFRSRRVGRRGRAFAMYKFRTMEADAEHKLDAYLTRDPQARLDYAKHYKLKVDPRITLPGHFLRKYSLDELPQLINVLKGDMSLIGPRPRLLREIADAERYNEHHFEAYFLCRPGMTGLWQVSGRAESDYHTRVRLDALYVRQMSFVQDMLIAMKTVPVVLMGRGEY